MRGYRRYSREGAEALISVGPMRVPRYYGMLRALRRIIAFFGPEGYTSPHERSPPRRIVGLSRHRPRPRPSWGCRLSRHDPLPDAGRGLSEAGGPRVGRLRRRASSTCPGSRRISPRPRAIRSAARWPERPWPADLRSPRLAVFHHGIGWGWLGMIRYMELFRAEGWTVVAYDSRGHGLERGRRAGRPPPRPSYGYLREGRPEGGGRLGARAIPPRRRLRRSSASRWARPRSSSTRPSIRAWTR
jgi:hypothetical protein